MKNVTAMMQVIRDSHLPIPKHCHLMDQITEEDRAYFAEKLGVDADEKILFAIGGANDTWHGISRIKPLCITDKQLHITSWSIFREDLHLQVEEIHTAELGEAVYVRTTRGRMYDGHPVIINGDDVMHIQGMYGMGDMATAIMVRYALAAVSDEFTVEQFRTELAKWDNAPEKMLRQPMSLGLYALFSFVTWGLLVPVQAYIHYYKLRKITEKHGYEPLQNYFLALLLSIPTLGIMGLIWRQAFLDRMKQELDRRDLMEGVGFSPAGTWFWGFVPYAVIAGISLYLLGVNYLSWHNYLPQSTEWVFVAILVIVCELVYRYRIIKYMTVLVNDYNMKG